MDVSVMLAHGTMVGVTVLALLATRFLFMVPVCIGDVCLPPPSRRDTLIFFWYAFDLLTHWTIEFWFVLMALWPNGGTRSWEGSFIAVTWQEYAHADLRWWHLGDRDTDEGIVAVEMITVFGAGAILVLLLHNMRMHGDMVTRHFLNIVLCTAELYGGWMTFGPEWITGNKNLAPLSDIYLNWLLLWIANGVWVVVPLLLLKDSFTELKRQAGSIASRKELRRSSPRKQA